MTIAQDVEDLLSRMSRAEKAQLLRTVIRDLDDAHPGIESTPGVVGGSARIVRMRIPVWLLDRARRLGSSEADLLMAYPSLRAEDLVNAWAYARTHRDEIDREIEENESA